MLLNLSNAAGRIFVTLEYDAANHWVYANWIGDQTYIGLVAGTEACLRLLHDNNCSCLFNDNRHVLSPWDNAHNWPATGWASHALAQGLTHLAHLVRPTSLISTGTEVLQEHRGKQLQLRAFAETAAAQQWLREAQQGVSFSPFSLPSGPIG